MPFSVCCQFNCPVFSSPDADIYTAPVTLYQSHLVLPIHNYLWPDCSPFSSAPPFSGHSIQTESSPRRFRTIRLPPILNPVACHEHEPVIEGSPDAFLIKIGKVLIPQVSNLVLRRAKLFKRVEQIYISLLLGLSGIERFRWCCKYTSYLMCIKSIDYSL